MVLYIQCGGFAGFESLLLVLLKWRLGWRGRRWVREKEKKKKEREVEKRSA